MENYGEVQELKADRLGNPILTGSDCPFFFPKTMSSRGRKAVAISWYHLQNAQQDRRFTGRLPRRTIFMVLLAMTTVVGWFLCKIYIHIITR